MSDDGKQSNPQPIDSPHKDEQESPECWHDLLDKANELVKAYIEFKKRQVERINDITRRLDDMIRLQELYLMLLRQRYAALLEENRMLRQERIRFKRIMFSERRIPRRRSVPREYLVLIRTNGQGSRKGKKKISLSYFPDKMYVPVVPQRMDLDRFGEYLDERRRRLRLDMQQMRIDSDRESQELYSQLENVICQIDAHLNNARQNGEEMNASVEHVILEYRQMINDILSGGEEEEEEPDS